MFFVYLFLQSELVNHVNCCKNSGQKGEFVIVNLPQPHNSGSCVLVTQVKLENMIPTASSCGPKPSNLNCKLRVELSKVVLLKVQ